MSLFHDAFRNKRILITGHTGFKGAWLALWLHKLGAETHGFALAEDPIPAAYSALGVREILKSEHLGDIGELGSITGYLERVEPEIVLHLAAQPIVRESYRDPIGTLATNFMGTAHVLEALRLLDKPVVCVVVTSDKCYENPETGAPCQETDRMGGYDVYSMSKGACELLVSSYRRSFFSAGGKSFVKLASARAGNSIGGGDFAADRIVPDCIRALANGRKISVRNPESVRPWQHVFEPLSGYLELTSRLLSKGSEPFCEGWNFGPQPADTLNVREVVDAIIKRWGSGEWEQATDSKAPHESKLLRLDIAKSAEKLGWRPTWDARRALMETVDWYSEFERSKRSGKSIEGSMRVFSLDQIERFERERLGLER